MKRLQNLNLATTDRNAFPLVVLAVLILIVLLYIKQQGTPYMNF